MEVQAQSEWVFNTLLDFLKGPVWNIPILTFIEQKSIVFEPGIDNENEYHKIHNEYKNLVDFMLGSFMEDTNVTPDYFEEACGQTNKDISSEFHRSLFEQVWAADDYEIFKRMMTQKNIELQLQALEVLAQKQGTVPQSLMPDSNSKLTKEEAELMEEIMRRAKSNEVLSPEEGEDQFIKATLAEKARLEAERDYEKQMLDKAMKLSLQEMNNEIKTSSKKSLPPLKTTVQENFYTTPIKTEVNPEEVKKRQEYLRKQRDRLMSMKKEERKKQLVKYTQETGGSRPKSSRAAQRAVSEMKENVNVDPNTLAFRKSLADRLKSEVVVNQTL
ncbi:cilia- and flagella-associated protein 36-like [Centruroides sculpturatus]|uniref:cilia- and flagella-associated protein 36-like n=1 Tax=Centruroides sculpturatus TaxID=218467 RepID=UPI000C6E7099|nr:cilia- and flagella-associated protein 36-like [Centruroides sculpturatus]